LEQGDTFDVAFKSMSGIGAVHDGGGERLAIA